MGTRPLSLRTGLLIVATGLLLIGGGCAMVVKAFFKEKQSAPKVISAVAAETKDYLLIEGYIVTVDPVTGRMELELYFHPRGRFDAGQGLLAVPLEVEVSSIGGEPLMFEAGRRMFPQAVEFGFWDGSVADYPIDLHQVQIELRVLEATGGDGPRVVVPVKLEMDAQFHGLAGNRQRLHRHQHSAQTVTLGDRHGRLLHGGHVGAHDHEPVDVVGGADPPDGGRCGAVCLHERHDRRVVFFPGSPA
jgi:hypothetical protein